MFDPVCIIMIRMNCCLLTKAANACFWIITALIFIGIPTAITIECLKGLALFFTQKGQIRQPPNDGDTLLEMVSLNQFTMDLTLNKSPTLK